MIHHAETPGGIPGLSTLPWGTHCCHFYDGRADLVDTLVPFFKAGLDANNACLWVTSQPFLATDARAALGAAVPDLAQREEQGQIEIIDHEQWYLRNGENDARAVLSGWLERERSALRDGYQGLRLTGNTYWLEREDWDSFMEYERRVNDAFRGQRIVGLCSYCSGRCGASDVLDVIANHEFTIARRGDTWQVLEGSALRWARRDLEELKQAAHALRESEQSKDEFIAMMGHELRNPLAPIANAEQLIRLRGGSALYGRELDTIQRQVRHLSRLVSDVLDVARLSRGKLELRRKRVELGEVVARALEMVSDLLSKRQHRVSLSVATRGSIVLVDDDRMTQVVVNVLTNAAKYTPLGGHISIATRQQGDKVALMVGDNGPGIPAQLLPRVFESFVQGSRAPDRTEGGLGLGLPIVKALVEAHGGRVRLESAEGRGTQVSIELPLVEASQSRANPLSLSPVSVSTLPAPRRKRVLVVDENADGGLLLGEFLSERGYDVDVAQGAAAALGSARSRAPDCAILDLAREAPGTQLAARLRELPGSRELMLIALTEPDSDWALEQGIEMGFRCQISKPVELSQLLAALDELFANRSRAQA